MRSDAHRCQSVGSGPEAEQLIRLARIHLSLNHARSFNARRRNSAANISPRLAWPATKVKRGPAIAEKLAASWALIGQRAKSVDGGVRRDSAVSVVFARSTDDETDLTPEYVDEESEVFVEQLKWGKAFREHGLAAKGSGFTPELMTKETNVIKEDAISYTLGFCNAPASDLKQLHGKTGNLKASMGLAHITILPHQPKGGRERADWFTIISATNDPLDEEKLFVDYAGRVLSKQG